MLQTKHLPDKREETLAPSTHLPRRNFLSKMMGAAAITAVAASCTKSISGTDGSDLDADRSVSSITNGTLSIGSSDYAVLNYAYLLEQLEAQFYTMVTDSFFSGATIMQKRRLSQIRDHEVAHREFFKTALGSHAIPSITFNLSSVDFSSSSSVLSTAQSFEDLGVSAYNGAGKYIKSPDYLTIAGKIVSVEARHAAYIRDMVSENSFATLVDSNGLDLANNPNTVINAVLPYLPFKVNASKAPWNS